jgi:hypothetical protein
MDIDSAIREREGLAGRGAWHSSLPFFAFQKAWAGRFGGLPVHIVAFDADQIGRDTEKGYVTMYAVESTARRNFREVGATHVRRNLLAVRSPFDDVFDTNAQRFTVDDAGLRNSRWMVSIVALINTKITDLFKWAGPTG